jgi:hypothetical protein
MHPYHPMHHLSKMFETHKPHRGLNKKNGFTTSSYNKQKQQLRQQNGGGGSDEDLNEEEDQGIIMENNY